MGLSLMWQSFFDDGSQRTSKEYVYVALCLYSLKCEGDAGVAGAYL